MASSDLDLLFSDEAAKVKRLISPVTGRHSTSGVYAVEPQESHIKLGNLAQPL